MTRELLTLSLDQLRRRTSLKWRHYPPEVLPLWVAEMDVLPAGPVVDEVQRVMRTGDLGYPVARDYATSVTRWYQSETGVQVDPSQVRVTVDVLTGITHAVRALTDGPTPVVITTPVYPPFFSVVEGMGRPVVTAALTAEGRIDLETLAAAFRESGPGSSLLLSNPHNPTGVAHTREELRAVLALADEHDVAVVSDEIHSPLVLEGADFTSVLAVPEGAASMVVTSAAKGWNLAAFKAAAIIPGPAASAALARIPETTWMQTSHIAARAQAAALDSGQEWRSALLRDLAANRALLGELLDEHLPAIRWLPMEATYLAWLDCRELGLDDPFRHFLDTAKVALNPGPSFGPGGVGRVRLNLATSPEIITEAIERMADSLR